MRATIRIPTVQFGYIEFDGDFVDQEEAIKFHNRAIGIYEGTKAEVQKLKDDNF
jgi:hypothetical protein